VRLTIERMRTLVLLAGVLLIGALVIFLTLGKWKNPFNRRDLPQRLGMDIQQEANGFTYTQAHGGHTLFKIHASKVVQLKQGDALLHDVKIELYGEDGSRVDRIEGAEFQYDKKNQTATAIGPVEITLMRPGVAPAIAPKAAAGQALKKGAPVSTVAEAAARGEIHVKTTGLTFNQKSGVATTAGHVDFSMVQGSGSSLGATFDSQQGLLVLDRAVELNTRRGAETVQIHAQHAEFERDSQLCHLRQTTANYKSGQATAGEAKILFRDDGSAVRLDAIGGFALATATGSHLSAPSGHLEFDEHNQPRHGRLEGGVTMESASENTGRRRQMHGSASTAELEFTAQGQLHHAHLEQGVSMDSEEQSATAGQPQRLSRHWRSPVADVDFHSSGHGKVELSAVHGAGGVVVNGESQRGQQAAASSRLAADELTGRFGAAGELTEMMGTGHTSLDETNATGTRQTTSGDRLEASFAPSAAGGKRGTKSGSDAEAQIQAATVEGHVVVTQTPAAKPEKAKPGALPPSTLRATAGRADYAGAGEWLHLTQSPRIEDGALQLTAEKVDVSRVTGDALAHGNVKASWSDVNRVGKPAAAPGAVALGGQGPAHAVAAEAQLHKATGEATFRGQARLWQQANSVTAPVIVLDQARQTMMAHTTEVSQPVRAVLLSAPTKEEQGKSTAPSVIRVRGGELKYSDVERKALMQAGVLGTVTAETGTATSVSNEVEVLLTPTGKGGQTQSQAGQSQVDRMTARSHVVLTSEGRRGTGEQLVYTGATHEYVLTGTAAVPPKMTDPLRGMVTGQVLIFHGRDDSVSVEGGNGKTRTETTSPR
jgi:lipopolysaccharide export system protein LptA